MIALRLIERVAVGDGCPDELADPVPTWDELAMTVEGESTCRLRVGTCWVYAEVSLMDSWSVSFDEDETTVHPVCLDALTEIEARWWSAVAIAAAAGCPPHWVDMGFVPGSDVGEGVGWVLHEPVWIEVAAPDERGWWMWTALEGDGPDSAEIVHPTELKARLHAAALIGVTTR